MSFWAFIIIGIVILGIIAYANPQLVDEVKEKIEVIYISVTNGIHINNKTNYVEQINTPTLISKCRSSFNECREIYNKKYVPQGICPIHTGSITKKKGNVDF